MAAVTEKVCGKCVFSCLLNGQVNVKWECNINKQTKVDNIQEHSRTLKD